MGFVNLPSVDDIQQQKDPKQQMEMLINTLGLLMKELGEINGYLGGANIRANSITANKMDVKELSAISANLGHITAGLVEAVEIFGSYIATSQDYPRIEFSSTDNLLTAFYNALSYITIIPNLLGAPAMKCVVNGSDEGSVTPSAGGLTMAASNHSLNLVAWNDINLDAALGSVFVPNWSKVKNKTSGGTLQQEFDNLSTNLTALINSKINEGLARALFVANIAFDTGTRNLKIYNADGNTINTVNIP